MLTLKEVILRRPRHRWFSKTSIGGDLDGWFGGYKTMDQAVLEAMCEWSEDGYCWVAQGWRLTKAEVEERGDEFEWEIDDFNMMKIELPKHLFKKDLCQLKKI